MNFEHLTMAQRIDLISEIWDSMESVPVAEQVPQWHEEELSQRLANPNPKLIPWEDVKRELEQLE